ncbi:MAG: hypothetical protein ACRC6O_00220 [Flavobacterium sp.]
MKKGKTFLLKTMNSPHLASRMVVAYVSEWIGECGGYEVQVLRQDLDEALGMVA